MINNIHLLGKVIRELRESRAWTQEQLAGTAGITPRTVQRIEAGGKVSAETLMALASALGTDVFSLRQRVEELASRMAGIQDNGSGELLGGIIRNFFSIAPGTMLVRRMGKLRIIPPSII